MKFTGFTSGCVGKALTVIVCILLGVILAIGGEALAGYLLLTREGMVGYVADSVNTDPENPVLNFDDETKEKSILSWGQEIMEAVQDMSGQEIGNLEKLLGLSVISETLADATGVSAEAIKASTIEDIGSTISNNLTLSIAEEKFGIAFPEDIPLFSDEEFLAKPLSEAFENFTDHKLSDFINVTDDTNSVLSELSDIKISELQGSVGDEKIKSMLLSQIMTIDESSNKILRALKDCCIESQWTDETKTEYKTKQITEIVDGVETVRTVQLMGINERIETLLISEVVDIDDDSNVILRKMDEQGLKVTELGGEKVTEIVNSTTIGEIITINTEGDDKSEPIMIALKDTRIDGLNEKMKTIKLNEIFAEEDLATGALSLIDSDTVLSDVPSAITDVMQSATTATLKGKGLIDADLSTLDNSDKFKKEQKSFILNSNIGQMMEELIEFVADPIVMNRDPSTGLITSAEPNYALISPHQREIAQGEFASISDFVAAYEQFETVTFTTATVTISVDETKDAKYLKEINGVEMYCIPVFNGIAGEGIGSVAITFDTSVLVRLAVLETEGTEIVLSRSQYAYAYFTDVTTIEGSVSTIGDFAANDI